MSGSSKFSRRMDVKGSSGADGGGVEVEEGGYRMRAMGKSVVV